MLAIKADCVCLMELYVETFLPVAQVNENKGRWKEGRKEMRRIQIQSSIDFILSVQSALSALFRPVLLSRVALHLREVVVVDKDVTPDVKLVTDMFLHGDDEYEHGPRVEGEAGPGEHEYIKQRPELEDGLGHGSVVYDHVEGR